MAEKKPTTTEPPTRDWTVTDGGTVVCFNSDKSNCVVINSLATAAELTPAHDESLARATEEINNILAGVLEKNKYNKHHLNLLITHKGPFLAWVQPGVRRSDDEKTVESTFKLNSHC